MNEDLGCAGIWRFEASRRHLSIFTGEMKKKNIYMYKKLVKITRG
jgi:hypothetical protein